MHYGYIHSQVSMKSPLIVDCFVLLTDEDQAKRVETASVQSHHLPLSSRLILDCCKCTYIGKQFRVQLMKHFVISLCFDNLFSKKSVVLTTIASILQFLM